MRSKVTYRKVKKIKITKSVEPTTNEYILLRLGTRNEIVIIDISTTLIEETKQRM